MKKSFVAQILYVLVVIFLLSNCAKPHIKSFKGEALGEGNDSTLLSWQVLHARKVYLNKEKVAPQGSKIVLVQPPANTFRLRAKSGNKIKSKSLTINILEGELYGSREVLSGEIAQLSWSLSHPVKASLKEQLPNKQLVLLKDSLAQEGLVKVKPERTTTYFLEALGLRRSYTIEVRNAYLTGVNVINKGKEATLQWRVVPDAKKIYLTEGDQIIADKLPPEGGFIFYPEEDATYTLVVELPNKSIEKATHSIRIKNERPYIRGKVPVTELQEDRKYELEVFGYDRSKYPQEIKMYVLAHDFRGNFVTGLAQEEATRRKYFLSVIEQIEGEQFEVADFKVKEYTENNTEPYALSLTMDYSGSMYGNVPSLESAARNLIESKMPNDEISIVKFDDKLVRAVERQTNVQKIIQDAKFIGQSGGATALYAGASEGIKAIENSEKPKVLILFTDGQENSSFSFWKTHASTAQDFILQARAQNIRVFPVSFGTGTNTALLSQMATLGDGKHYEIEDETTITDIYQELPYLFKYYYEITYRPNPKEGERKTQLEYFNLQENKKVTGTTVIGNGFDLNAYEGYRSSLGIGNTSNQTNTQSLAPTGSVHKKPRVVQINQSQDDVEVLRVKKSSKNQPLTPAPKQAVAPPQVVSNYDFNKSDNYDIDKLILILDYLNQFSSAEIVIYGHSDLTGTEEGCQRISEERAAKVQQFFLQKGIQPSRIKVKALGRTSPIWPQEKEPWMALENRRVEVVILK